jgi:hypothetical protein
VKLSCRVRVRVWLAQCLSRIPCHAESESVTLVARRLALSRAAADHAVGGQRRAYGVELRRAGALTIQLVVPRVHGAVQVVEAECAPGFDALQSQAACSVPAVPSYRAVVMRRL